ncbi:MAG: (d)CMP kinase [Oscillospiraceae bacterium]|nr:(d)CMP kinase [Oscillospiraceae bacterium]
MKRFSVAIDGPAGAGKSTLAKAAAARLGFVYVDTGAIYRTVGLAARNAGVDKADSEGIKALLTGLQVDIRYENGVQRMYLNGGDVTGEIRSPEISAYASYVSAIPEVRAFLMEMQRRLAREHDVIMDGRDIGTVVLPEAGLKIFLTASAEKRAMRRFRELQEKNPAITFEEVLSDMTARDAKDSQRETAPLKAAEDAVLVDTSDLSLEESVELIVNMIARQRETTEAQE